MLLVLEEQIGMKTLHDYTASLSLLGLFVEDLAGAAEVIGFGHKHVNFFTPIQHMIYVLVHDDFDVIYISAEFEELICLSRILYSRHGKSDHHN